MKFESRVRVKLDKDTEGQKIGRKKMNEEIIIDVIDRLIGDYRPYGETNHDTESNNNLTALCNVIAYYIEELYKITKNTKRVEYSIKESGMIADDFFYQMSDYFNEWEKENEQAN